MNAQAILDKIAEDARNNAQSLQDDARQKAAAALEATRHRLAEDDQAMRARAENDGAELSQRMGRMAELENRKALLQQKRVVMDEAFERAQALFEGLDAAKKRAFYLQKLCENASGDEALIVGDHDAQWFDDRFLADASEMLQKQGKTAALTLADGKRAGVTGFLLQKDGTEVNCTLAAMIGDLRMEMETEVAALLFSEA